MAAFASLSQRIFSSVHALGPDAACPTMDVVAFTSDKGTKLSLWRVAGQAGSVWQTDVVHPLDSVAWSPNGRYLAYTTLGSKCIKVLSAHSGAAVAPELRVRFNPEHTKVPKASCLFWLELPAASHPQKTLHPEELIKRLPTLTPMRPEEKTPLSGMSKAATAVTGGASLVTAETPDPFSLSRASPAFPTPLPGKIQGNDSIIIHSQDHLGGFDLFLNGNIALGHITLGENATLLSAQVIQPGKSLGHASLGLFWASHDAIHFTRAEVPLPHSTVSELSRAAEPCYALLDHMYQTLAKPLAQWKETEQHGTTWIEKLGDSFKDNDASRSLAHHLLTLLAIGKASTGVQEFLTAKQCEKSLQKWETSFAELGQHMRPALYQSLVPACERIVLWLEYLKAAAECQPMTVLDKLDLPTLDECLSLLCSLIKCCTELERTFGEDERSFEEFAKWVRYETDVLHFRENGSPNDAKPTSRFDIAVVGRFLADGLTFSKIDQLLRHDTPLDGVPESQGSSSQGSLGQLKEALRAGHPLPPLEFRKPQIHGIPDLLDALAERLGRLFRNAFGSFGSRVVFQEPIMLGNVKQQTNPLCRLKSYATPDGQVFATFLTVNASLRVWLIKIDQENQVKVVHFGLHLEDGTMVEVTDYNFFDDQELALIGKTSGGDDSTNNFLATIDYASMEWDSIPITPDGAFAVQTKTSKPMPLVFSRFHSFGGQMVPEALALNGRPGRRTACLLAAEGRLMENFDLEVAEPEDEDADME